MNTQTLVSAGIIIFLILIIWSRIMGQKVLDTVLEIKEIVTNLGK